jgi:hypothetical protein
VKTVEFSFPIEIGAVNDIDLLANGDTLLIQGTENQQILVDRESVIRLPEGWSCPEFPFVRDLTDGRILVVDTGFDVAGEKNAWILNRNGQIAANFAIGSAAVEIVCLNGMIAVAYHPDSARAHGYQVHPIQRAGIAFYDLNGQLTSGFNQESSWRGLSVSNIRCMTRINSTQLLFAPETATQSGRDIENPIVIYDFASRSPIVIEAPFARPEALAMTGHWIHMASPEGWEDQIITFDPKRKISQHRGDFQGLFRGHESGGFLCQLSAADYALVLPGEMSESVWYDEFFDGNIGNLNPPDSVS